MTIPDVAEPVAAWRLWDLAPGDDGPELVSPLRPLPWPGRRAATAACDLGCGRAPGALCTCGLYAMTDMSRLYALSFGRGRVLGCTALWGRVVEHVDGFRGEFGYPLVLFLLPDLRVRFERPARTGPVRRDDGIDRPAEDRRLRALARSLGRRYAVPAGVVPDPPITFRDEGRARAVLRESAVGMVARRAGDGAALDRLAAAAEALFGGFGGGLVDSVDG